MQSAGDCATSDSMVRAPLSSDGKALEMKAIFAARSSSFGAALWKKCHAEESTSRGSRAMPMNFAVGKSRFMRGKKNTFSGVFSPTARQGFPPACRASASSTPVPTRNSASSGSDSG